MYEWRVPPKPAGPLALPVNMQMLVSCEELVGLNILEGISLGTNDANHPSDKFKQKARGFIDINKHKQEGLEWCMYTSKHVGQWGAPV